MKGDLKNYFLASIGADKDGKLPDITLHRKIKVLNLYAGLGGNRKNWTDNFSVTAVEIEPKIADIYRDFFPNDTVIVGDAHKYLEEHFAEFDFIWSSPPCPSHSRVRKGLAVKTKKDGTKFVQNKPIFPDMKLYEEILFLQHYFKGKWVVENVIPYYEPLIKPQKIGRHCFWSNIQIPEFSGENKKQHWDKQKDLQE